MAAGQNFRWLGDVGKTGYQQVYAPDTQEELVYHPGLKQLGTYGAQGFQKKYDAGARLGAGYSDPTPQAQPNPQAYALPGGGEGMRTQPGAPMVQRPDGSVGHGFVRQPSWGLMRSAQPMPPMYNQQQQALAQQRQRSLDLLRQFQAPNKINSYNFLRLPQSTQQHTLGGYEELGWAAGDVAETIQNMLPRAAGARRGFYRAPGF